jgi:pilus assembly protein CpaF
VLAGASICVTGAPAVGKTTLLRALVAEIPWENVVVTVEDDRELGTHLLNRHAVVKSYEQRLPNAEGMGGFTVGDALNQALRDSPTRIVVGEVRGSYVVHLLDAVTNGIAGAMCTLHTPTARGVFERMLINAQKATPTPSAELVMRSLSALNLIVHVERNQANDRYVAEVLELGRVGDNGDPDATSIFTPGPERRAVGVPGSLSPDLAERLGAVGFSIDWLRPENSTWFDSGSPR